MPEHTDGHQPSSGELQARAAEKIIQGAQRKAQQPNLGIERPGTALPAPSEQFDRARLADIRQRLSGEPKADTYKYPHVVTPNGVATTPEELAQLSEAWRKESEERFERQRLEALAKINATKRLPFWKRLSLLITGIPPEGSEELVEEERKN